MAMEMVDLPVKNGGFPVRYVNVYHLVSTGISWPGQVVVKRVSFPAYDRRETCYDHPIFRQAQPLW